MLKLIYILIFLEVSYIAQKPNTNKLEFANRLEVNFLKGKVIAPFVLKDKSSISIFKELIRAPKKNANLKCDTTGEIVYFNNKTELFKIYFSTRISKSKYKSPAIIVQNATSMMSYRVGMYLDEKFYQFNSQK